MQTETQVSGEEFLKMDFDDLLRLAKKYEDKLNSRWVTIRRTTPSGKTLFFCRSCERVSISPDKYCPDESCEHWRPL